MKALIALFAASLVTTAIADDHPKEDRAMRTTDAKFEKLDRDNDERLSKSEARKEDTLAAQFASVDQDADGFISKSEYTAQLDTSTEERRPYNEPYEPQQPEP
jgi:Ca2+-binding EF-hand superfamily protein